MSRKDLSGRSATAALDPSAGADGDSVHSAAPVPAIELRGICKAFGPVQANKDISIRVMPGTIHGIIGENGAGKTTLLRCLMNELTPDHGKIKWSENAALGYCPQDSTADFDCDLTLFDWMSQWRKPRHDDQIVRATLGRLLFSADDFNKKARVCSGGEKKTACCSAS